MKRLGIITGILTLLGAGAADAGWLILRNDTPQVLLVQESDRPGRPHRLYPGESVRSLSVESRKTLVVSLADAPAESLHQEIIECPTTGARYSIRREGTHYRIVPIPR